MNVIFFGSLVIWTFFFTIVATPVGIWRISFKGLSFAQAVRDLVHKYGTGCCRILSSQIPITIENRVGDLPRPCIVTPNHQSFFDPYCMGFFPFRNLVFVVRSWPFRIPFYGYITRRAGYLNVEELDADGFLRKAGELLDGGATLIMFPEGTRSPDGTLGRFRSGAFTLALKHGVPILPMCIDGTGTVFPKGSRYGRPSAVRVTLLEPVRPECFAQFGDAARLRLQRHVKAAMSMTLEVSRRSGPIGETNTQL